MPKRTFLMLAHTYKPEKTKLIGGWFFSIKLDGMRAFWDGGITRGLPASEVPWANTEKDHIRVNAPIATGLWSRYGNVIYAPDWFLDKLPNRPLDGELWIGPKTFQTLISITKRFQPDDRWKDVKYMIFDSPSYKRIFADGEIDETNFKKKFHNILNWISQRPNAMSLSPSHFGAIYNYLKNFSNFENEVVKIHEQIELPIKSVDAQAKLDELMNQAVEQDHEGCIIRAPGSFWTPERVHTMLKYKPYSDAEGKVIGYTWGRETDKGSKLLGKMGAMLINYKGQRLKLSGFTDAERRMELLRAPVNINEPTDQQGQEISNDWHNPTFPIGSIVTFLYREETDGGIPKEGRYHRKYYAD